MKRYTAIILCLVALLGAGCSLFPDINDNSYRTEENGAPTAEAGSFSADKYKSEPTVKVWFADTGTIKEMPLETYLEGVVAQEMITDFPLEALAAQAICSRTIALNAIEAGTIKKLHGADVSTSKDELQAYDAKKVTDKVKEAVRRTRGEVILYNGALINSIYSACNGQIGATKEESFPEEIEGDTPYFQPVEDHCFDYAPDEYVSWEVDIDGWEVANAIGVSDPSSIRIVSRGPSGRILKIGTEEKNIYGSEFRRRIGYERLKSTLVHKMDYDGSKFTFSGAGWGNGIGLCQWGAYGYAEEGKKAEEIIGKYYIDTTIQKLYE